MGGVQPPPRQVGDTLVGSLLRQGGGELVGEGEVEFFTQLAHLYWCLHKPLFEQPAQ